MRIEITEAQALIEAAMRGVGYGGVEAKIIADQIVDCELRGVKIGGLSRALSIAERVQRGPAPIGPMRVMRETPVSALIEGGDNTGYLVAHRATELAIAKAQQSGIAIVGANDTWYTGMYAHYMQLATRAGLVALCAGSSAPRVAPYGSSEGRFGTNPIAFAFPSMEDPIILDIGTSTIMVGDCVLNARLGLPLAEGLAYGPNGEPTTDPLTAISGAFKVWGGHKGSGLATVVQLFGLLVGGGMFPPDNKECAFLAICIRPDLFGDEQAFRARVSEYAEAVRSARPLDPAQPMRMPFDRSAALKREHLAQGWFEAPESLVGQLRALSNG